MESALANITSELKSFFTNIIALHNPVEAIQHHPVLQLDDIMRFYLAGHTDALLTECSLTHG